MVKRFNKLIDREIKNVLKGKPASIIIKLNNLQERDMISRLYEASQAGVKVQLLVRSICCLAAGVEGQSENNNPSTVLLTDILNMQGSLFFIMMESRFVLWVVQTDE
ncbi:MAG: hypothetical protein IPH18_18135 [Chitinophagaceae bacterium]|nr:hypothetical protein [Chitinophagaceae bacterium]